MSLLNFKDIFTGRKEEDQPQTPEVENPVTIVDNQTAEHHKKIEGHIFQATNEPVPAGSSIPAINTDPIGPLTVIQGPKHEDVMIDRLKTIKATTPSQYESYKTGLGNPIDRILHNKDGLTDTKGLMSETQKRDAAKAALNQQIASELKKAA